MLETDQIGKKKPSVIHLADYGAPYAGNFMALLLELGGKIEDSDLKHILILPHRAGKRPWFKGLTSQNVHVYLIDTNSSILNISKQIADIFIRENAIIIHTHFTRFDVPSYIASIIASLKGLKRRPHIIWHVHSNFFIRNTIIRRIKDRLKWSCMGKDVYVICDSEELAEIVRKKKYAGETSVIINGIDIVRAKKTNMSNHLLRKRLGISEDNLLMLAFGWSPYIKGVDLLIKAAEKINRDDISILIIGRNELKRYIDDEFDSLPRSVVLAEPDECVGNLYNAADVFISASRREGCPYSVMEAMANGLPVIASNIRAMKWAEGLKGVLFFETCNIHDLIKKILEVSNMDPERRTAISKENAEFIETNYSKSTWVNNIFNIYKKLLIKAW